MQRHQPPTLEAAVKLTEEFMEAVVPSKINCLREEKWGTTNCKRGEEGNPAHNLSNCLLPVLGLKTSEEGLPQHGL